ncbi:lipopolysaccharide biosynthesis protein [Bdellovibrio bacteriovorus]|uniref:Putative O-antigen translocase n=1 Tax=Bdellovibrio bacteriovorus str. Tiberius TaxID=1069642 RepID=K7YXC2_BDEBC|nr:O-antigen translocase [Bdellovibrio bacteriovorus]AFY01370.1 putative O-antigen translocase [Bdellovibrio bacteriovorus str. Tiberius]
MFKDVFSLASSSVLGQVINLCVLLFVARLVSVETYGAYAVCITLVGYMVVLVSAKYQHVIFSGSLAEARKLTAGNFVFTGGLAVVGFAATSATKFFFDKLQTVSFVELLLISIAGFCSASNLFYYYLSLREDRLRVIFRSRLIPPLLGGIGMVIYASLYGSQTGLLFFYTLTNIFALVILRRGSEVDWTLEDIWLLLKKYRKFPMFLLPAGALEVFNSGFLLLASSELFGLEISAAFGLYLRLVASPQGLVVNSIGDTLRKRIASSSAGDLPRLLIRIGLVLFGVSLAGALVIFLFSKFGLGLLLGEKWNYAGKYFVWMLPVFVLSFVVPSLSVTLYVFNGQRYDLFIQVFTAALYSGVYYFFKASLEAFVVAFVASNCLKYVVELVLCFKCIGEVDETT